MATRFEEIQIERVHANAANIREDMGDMETLTSEVKTIGIRNPLLVYPHPTHEGDFMVQDGHRRLEAASANGDLFVPCLIIDAPKRGLREDIEVMLSTGRAAKVLNPLEVSFGFEQLVADGMDETTIGKKYKVPKSEVKTRARVSTAPEKLKESFADGKLSLVDMKRIQDLEDAGIPEVFEAVVARVSKDAAGNWGANVENIIATEEAHHETALLRAALVDQGANEAADYSVRHDGKHDDVTDKSLVMSVAGHIEAKHVFYISSGEVRWYAKRVKAKPEPTAEELEEAQLRRSLEAGLSIQARVRGKYLVDLVHANENPAGKDADAELLFWAVWRTVQHAADDLLAALSGIAEPEEPDEVEDTVKAAAVREAWKARVEKAFRKMSWQQLARIAVIVQCAERDKSLGRLSGFDREKGSWAMHREWYGILQEQLGYRLDESERNAVLWAELQGGVSNYWAKPTEGENRNLDEDLVIINDEA